MTAIAEVKGNTATTSGGYTVRMFVAGDANVDGRGGWIGRDPRCRSWYSKAADANGDGVVNSTDLQLSPAIPDSKPIALRVNTSQCIDTYRFANASRPNAAGG